MSRFSGRPIHATLAKRVTGQSRGHDAESHSSVHASPSGDTSQRKQAGMSPSKCLKAACATMPCISPASSVAASLKTLK